MSAAIGCPQKQSYRPASGGKFGVSQLYIECIPPGDIPKVTEETPSRTRLQIIARALIHLRRERVETRTYGARWGPISAASKSAPVFASSLS
jgi:hypothetical protein